MTYRHGLTIGKFYPPHLGHLHLIETACAAADLVTVLVIAAEHETLPLDVRVRVLRQTLHERGIAHARVIGLLEDSPTDFASDAAWVMHLAVDRAALASEEGRGALPPPVDAVFTSETYGYELAHRLGADHVCVDIERAAVPVRANHIRTALAAPITTPADPARGRAWSQLLPGSRAALSRRVCLVGAESTGKTTLARALAAHYDTAWVPEYGRFYSERRAANAAAQRQPEPAWRDEEFMLICRQQHFDEDMLAATGGPVLICDTDALATGVWQWRYTGQTRWDVAASAAARTYTAYLLTSPEGVSWEDDGLRDGANIRADMHQLFLDRMTQRTAVTGEPWTVLNGSMAQRLSDAVTFLDPLLPTP